MYVRLSSMYKDILAHCFNKQHTHTHTHYKYDGDFPGCPVVKTLSYNAGSVSSISGRGAEIPHASWPEHQNIKQKRYCNKFNKDFENAPHQKKKNLKKNTMHAINRGKVAKIFYYIHIRFPNFKLFLVYS